MQNILIVYRSLHYPIRNSIEEHLYSFENYSNHKIYYLNTAFLITIPWYLKKIKFDLIIFHTTFLGARWSPDKFIKLTKKLTFFAKSNTKKVMLPQDEFIYTDLLNDFINNFEIDYIFSVAPETEWVKIYNRVNFDKVNLERVLTGYIDTESIKKVNAIENTVPRSIDIGYRAWNAPSWLGEHGLFKVGIGEIFKKQCISKSIKLNISNNEEDTFYGDDWLKFLLKCRYTIGVEGGASVLDRYGDIRKLTEEYILQHPNADFFEIRENCFPNKDGELQLFALSPRHLEACLTKTCQILLEGNYNGILKPSIHYIELKKDLSNIGEVLQLIGNETLRKKMTEQAYIDIIESGLYSYRNFVEQIFNKVLHSNNKQGNKQISIKIIEFVGIVQNRITEKLLKILGQPVYHIWQFSKNAKALKN